MRFLSRSAFVVALSCIASTSAFAQIVDTRLGPMRVAVTIPSFGQTFTAPAGATSLDRFTFFIASNAAEGVAIPFRAYLYQWNGTRALGAELYDSGDLEAPLCCAPQAMVFETGSVPVMGGLQYVAFILPASGSISMSFPTVADTYTDSYAGGRFTFTECAADPTSCDWYFSGSNPGLDGEFVAQFSNATVVPEPSSFAMLGLGVLLAGGLRHARRRGRPVTDA